MIELQQGIYTKVTAAIDAVHNDFYNDIGGRFYFEVAPQNTNFPYCTYHIIHDAYDYLFKDDFEEVIVQFSIFSNNSSSTEVGAIQSHLKALFDWCSLTVTGYKTISVERLFSTTDWIDEDIMWLCALQYRIHLIKD
jgi:hypothetical protein